YVWFDDALAEIQVSRNHVSGYRVATNIFGHEGQIQIGHFDQKPFYITVSAYGRRGKDEPIAHRVFEMRRYDADGLPEFVDRFGPAYKEEVDIFVNCCLAGDPFPTSHVDGLKAQEVISAGMRAMLSDKNAAALQDYVARP